jgi:hypothetical protein
MDILKIKQMQGNEEVGIFKNFLDFLTSIAPWGACTIAFWKFIDWLARYMEDTRKARVREIVKETLEEFTNPQIDRLSESIDKLKEAIWELKDKK